jgi:RNA polymerase sigma-70 factor (ECF subfamily)
MQLTPGSAPPAAAFLNARNTMSRSYPALPLEKSETGAAATARPATALTGTLELLQQFRRGDTRARDLLVERSLPQLRKWARGRLPRWARSLADTQDLVQDAVMRALPKLESFDARHPGALQAYLRQAVQNRIYDEVRKVSTRGSGEEPPEEMPDSTPSPLEQAIGRQGFERYEHALQALKPADRDAIIGRFELQQSYEELAIALGRSNANAARMAVTRALARLIEAMRHER